jgi:SAM-dependent methyltransferase
MSMAMKAMGRLYRQAAGDPMRLPWHRASPSGVLAAAVSARHGRGRALDVGCGAGIFTLWLASRGMTATGIDLFPEAIAMAHALLREELAADFVVTDLFSYAPDGPFDLVFDSGCLHALVGGNVDAYKRRLLAWLAPGGDYVLEHWTRRHLLDWRPVGPRRRTPEAIQRLFAPELTLVATEVTDFSVPLPLGPTVRGVGYLFRRTG